jgi:hypothetical protein
MGNFSNILNARIVGLFMLVLTAMVVFYIGKEFGVGWFAAVFFLSCPIIMEFGRVMMGDIPLLFYFSAFLWGILGRTKKYVIFTEILVGVAAAFAILTKIQVIPVIAVLYAYMLYNREYEKAISMGVCCFIFLGALFFFPGMLGIFNTGSYNVDRAMTYLTISVVFFLIKGAFLIMFAVYGAIVALSRKNDRDTNIMYMVLLSVVTILVYSWSSYRQLMFMIPALAVFAGIGLKNLKVEFFIIAVLVFSILVPVYEWHKTIAVDQETRDLVAKIQQNVPEGVAFYSDQPILAFLANRSMPNTAAMWNGMGRLHEIKAEDVIGDINKTSPPMVVLVTGTPVSMDQPRILSTFGNEGSAKIISFLDANYPVQDFARRDYQLLRIWRKTSVAGAYR